MNDNSRATPLQNEPDEVGLFELLLTLLSHWKLLVFGPALCAALAVGIAFTVPPSFTSRTVFLPPQQGQSSAASALAQLGALGGLAGVASGMKTTGDQYVALLQSESLTDRIIDRFRLMEVYEEKYRVKARNELASNTRVSFNKKDGLISVEVDDLDPQRAADIANQYIAELRTLTNGLALTEVQQRRMFMEGQLKQTRERLAQAQVALQSSGFGQSALRADVRSAAETYARLRAEVTAAEIRLQTLRTSMADGALEVQQAAATLQSLRSRLANAEGDSQVERGPDYVSKYREFKYQETLFDLYARQFELARADESREGALIQVIDPAKPAELKSKPRRAQIGMAAWFASTILLVLWVATRHFLRQSSARDGAEVPVRQQIRDALRGDPVSGFRPVR